MEFEHRGGGAPNGEPTPSEAKRPEKNQPTLEVGEGRHGVPPPQGEPAQPQPERVERYPLFSLLEQDATRFGRRVIGGLLHLEDWTRSIKDCDEAMKPHSGIEVVTYLPDGRRRRLDQRELQEVRRMVRPEDLGGNPEEAYLRGLEDALRLVKEAITGKFDQGGKATSNAGESGVKK